MLFDHDLKRPGGDYAPAICGFLALEGRYTEADKAQRERLERATPSATNAPRRDFVGFLNGEMHLPVTSLESIAKIRDRYQYNGGHRSAEQHNAAHERYLAKSADSENFNRLHPGSRLARGSDFDFRPGEPGNNLGSRFEWSDEFAPPQGVSQVPDARGSAQGDNRGGRHFANGEPADIDAQFLLAVARAVIAMVNSREYGRGRV